jgi:hypothetical protein
MKKMTLMSLLLIFSLNTAFAQMDFNTETIEKKTMISVYDLQCVLPLGRQSQIFSELRDLRLMTFPEIEMEHRNARIAGCDSTAMESLWIDSSMRFGFVDVRLKIVKGTSVQSRVVFGKCQRNYQEQLFLEFNHGLTLKTSLIGKLIPADDCN